MLATMRKALVAGLGAAGAAAGTALADGRITTAEWGIVAGALMVGVLTYLVPNRPADPGRG